MGWNQISLRAREPRYSVRIDARMLSPRGWSNVAIRNVSRHGMLLRCDAAPRPGSFIEIRHGNVVVVARAVWCDGQVFGVRAQDPIDVGALQGGAASSLQQDGILVERRLTPRDIAATGVRAQQFGRQLQFVVLALALVVGAVLAAGLLRVALAAPLADVHQALGGNAAPGPN